MKPYNHTCFTSRTLVSRRNIVHIDPGASPPRPLDPTQNQFRLRCEIVLTHVRRTVRTIILALDVVFDVRVSGRQRRDLVLLIDLARLCTMSYIYRTNTTVKSQTLVQPKRQDEIVYCVRVRV